MTLEEMAQLYQDTGVYLPEARKAESDYIESRMQDIKLKYRDYVNGEEFLLDEYPMTLSTFVDIEIGHWQARNGFYRSFNDS